MQCRQHLPPASSQALPLTRKCPESHDRSCGTIPKFPVFVPEILWIKILVAPAVTNITEVKHHLRRCNAHLLLNCWFSVTGLPKMSSFFHPTDGHLDIRRCWDVHRLPGGCNVRSLSLCCLCLKMHGTESQEKDQKLWNKYRNI